MFYQNLYDFEYTYYDAFYNKFVDDIQFLKKIISPDAKILELMCGTGRIISHFIDHEIWGIDNNPHMLNIAIKKFKNIPNVHLHLENVLEIKLNQKFDVVLIPLNSFMLGTEKDQCKILINVKNTLTPHGTVIIDVLNGFPFIDHMVYYGDTITVDEKTISRFFVPMLEDNGEYVTILYFYDVFENNTYHRVYSKQKLQIMNLAKLKKVVKCSKLQIKEVYGNYDMSTYNKDLSERLLAILERNL